METTSILNYLKDFLLFLESNHNSPQTIYHYQKDLLILANFLKSRNLNLESLNKQKILEFKAYLSSDERKTATLELETKIRLSPTSINRCLSAIRAYIRFLIELDYPCPVSPDLFKMIKKERPHPRVAELDEIIKLIESPNSLESDPLIGIRNRAIFEVLFATGMRISELVSLNKKDLDGSGRIFITGKGRKQRFVYLTERAKYLLNEYLKIRSGNNPALFIPTKGKNAAKLNKRLTPRYIESKLQEYREKLEINIPITPHSLRHGFATYMAEKGASPVAIQILLGHESLATTTRYVNASDKFAEESHHKFHPLSLPDKDSHLA